MALATQCPHCKTTFRVALDQLKLRAGLVRCGLCKEIFNGIEHLLATDTAPVQPIPVTTVAEHEKALPVSAEKHAAPALHPATAPEPDVRTPRSVPAPASAALDFVYPDPNPEPSGTGAIVFVDFVELPRKQETSPSNVEPVVLEPHDEDYLPRTDTTDFTAAQLPAKNDVADLESPLPSDAPSSLQVIDEPPHRLLHDGKTHKPSARHAVEEAPEEPSVPEFPEPEEPGFLKQGRRKQKMGRVLNIVMSVASFMLLLGALGQATYIFRDQIAARLPETKPFLLTACSFARCNIGLPTQIETITIESDEMEPINPNKDDSVLTMLLRNVSTTAEAWPHIDLTLNDANGIMLARRVFAPSEYLKDAQETTKGLASNSEQPIKLYFEFSGVKPAGYHVGLFYP